jgi:uncharacterized repeat protein (TIGR02543 family)
MKTQKSTIIIGIFTALAVLGLLFAACGDPESGPTGGNTVPVTGVTLNKNTLSLPVDGTETLTATVTPSDASNKAVRWSSSDTSKATVDTNGKVTAKAAGIAKITVTTADGGFTADCNVTVQTAGPRDVPVTGVTLDNPAISLVVGESQTLTATVVPENATVKTVSWTSNPTAIATVDENGKVEAKAVGSAKITVTTTDGGKTAECIVTVTKVPVSIAVTTPPTKTLYATGEMLDITGMVVTATYDDNSTGIVAVTAEHISEFNPNTPGEQTLIITYGGITTTFKVTVLALTKIEVTKSPGIVAVGEPLDIEEIEVEATWGDDSTDKHIKKNVEITLANISDFDKDKAGRQTVTVTYEGETFDVLVLGVTEITIETEPTKNLYKTGETLDLDGLVVKATFSDGEERTVEHSALHITGFNSATAGDKTVTVTYGGESDTFTVTVIAVTKLIIETEPTKTLYKTGETLDLDGLVVKATWGDDSTDKYITEAVTITIANITGFNSTTAGTKTLTINFGGKSTTFTVTVVATVTFNPNGGNWNGDTANKTEEVAGTTITKPNDPVKVGYIFGEWYKEAALTNQWNFATDIVFINTILYAKWNPITYTVRYDKNANDASGTMADSSHTYDVEQALTTNGYTRTGYAFTGWNTQADGSGTDYADSQNVENLTVTAGGVITLYAKWVMSYTVRYDKNATDATGTTADSIHLYDVEKALTANGYTRTGYVFGGWNTQAGGGGTDYANGENVVNLAGTAGAVFTLYAKWVSQNDLDDFGSGANISNTFNVANTTQWNSAVSTISGGGNEKNYIINVTANFTVAGHTSNTFGNVTDVKVSIRGVGRALSLSSNGVILYVGNSQIVILRDITLQGRTSNNNNLVYVGVGGTLITHGVKITGNGNSTTTYIEGYGGGVFMDGTFTMNGGEISNNSVYVGFDNAGATTNSAFGGGVYMRRGSFTMNGGKIMSNGAQARYKTTQAYGAGVYVAGGIFTMNDGEIYENQAMSQGSSGFRYANGGGVYMGGGSFTMNGGSIRNNTTKPYYANGGGVYMDGGSFTMNGGDIYGNKCDGEANSFGGGVAINNVSSIIFTMNGGKIYGNSCIGNTGYTLGGGVHQLGGIFHITNGIIYGSNEADTSLRNITSGAVSYAALYKSTPATSQYGTFNGDTWVPSGNISGGSNTIRVVDGVLQP